VKRSVKEEKRENGKDRRVQDVREKQERELNQGEAGRERTKNVLVMRGIVDSVCVCVWSSTVLCYSNVCHPTREEQLDVDMQKGREEKEKKGAKEGYVSFLWNDGDTIRYTMMTATTARVEVKVEQQKG
jgi:hypothetical protein